MRYRFHICLLLSVLCIVFAFPAYAQERSLSQVSKENLEELKTDISNVRKSNFESLTSEEKETVLSLTQEKTASMVKYKGADLEWPWFDYTYSRKWKLLSVSTRFAYTLDGKKIDSKVYGEAYPIDGEYELVYLRIDDEVIVDNKGKLPDPLWSDIEKHKINIGTGIDLTILDSDALKALESDADAQIKAYHKTTSEDIINKLVKSHLEDYLAKQGFTNIEWPWFDYSYTCDWDCYTETTRLAYCDPQNQKIQKSVYAEVYKNDGDYEIFYIELGDDVLLDRRDEAASENCICYFHSLEFEAAQKMYEDGRYAQAEDAFLKLGDYCGSEYAATVCRERINQEKYDAALKSYDNGQYEEAQTLFLALGEFSDSAGMAEKCRNALNTAAYDKARDLKDQFRYEEAREIFLGLDDFEDSAEQAEKCTEGINSALYIEACGYKEQGEYHLALEIFLAIGEYQDSREQADDCRNLISEANYQDAMDSLKNSEFKKALELFTELGGYKDSLNQIAVCERMIAEQEYQKGIALMEGGHYDDAMVVFAIINGYQDSSELLQKCQSAKENIDRIIVVPETEFNLYQRKSYKLEPTIEGVNGSLPKKTTVLYKSSDPKIASVNTAGQVSGLRNGTVRIICSAKENPNVITEVIVHVITPVAQLKLDRQTLTIPVIEGNNEAAKCTITATVAPENAYDKTLTWVSSNENVATVDGNGTVTGVAPGQAIITATANDTANGIKKAACNVKVEVGVSKVILAASEGIVFILHSRLNYNVEMLPAVEN